MDKHYSLRPLLSLIFTFYFFLSSCSIEKQISRSANDIVLSSKALQTAHVGLSIFDPSKNKYLYDYQGDKYFVPASNTKIPTCYAAMKYLGDSLIGMRFQAMHHGVRLFPTGDPTFLLPEFKNQPVLDFFEHSIPDNFEISISNATWDDDPLGSGWSWNDYPEYYMAERSFMPMYGNMIKFSGKLSDLKVNPPFVPDSIIISEHADGPFIKEVNRDRTGNIFKVSGGNNKEANPSITFDTKNGEIVSKLLGTILNKDIRVTKFSEIDHLRNPNLNSIKSQPTDSVLKLMMHRSDNFFAEQLLLMVSNERLAVMNDAKIIDTILKTELKDLPQRPRWADGSGLSRYNLFTPQDFVTILNKMKNEFGMERIKVIFPTGGRGTISNYYKADSTFIYGKTGTLSGVVAFSGFMYTPKGKLLIFSTLVNNHQASSTDVRRAIEKFLQGVRNRY